MPNESTLICTPTLNGDVSVGYSSSLMRTMLLFLRNGIPVGTNYQIGDADISHARNFLCQRFLESTFANLLFIDADMTWDEQGALDLVRSPHLVCAAAYRKKIPDMIPQFSVEFHGQEIDGWQMATHVGAGILLIRREALELYSEVHKDRVYTNLGNGKPTTAFFQSGLWRDPNGGQDFHVSEDVDFCKRWVQTGMPLWVKKDFYTEHKGFNVWPGNIALHTVTDEAAKEQDAQRAEEIAAVGAHEPVIVHRDMAAESPPRST